MEVEESDGALGLLRPLSPLATARLFGLLHFGAFGYEVNGVLACESLDSRNAGTECGESSFVVGWYKNAGYLLPFPGVVETDMDCKCTMLSVCQVDVEVGVVAFFRSCCKRASSQV